MAMLILKPHLIEKILMNLSSLNNYELTKNVKNELITFFKNEGNKFFFNSLLLKKRRFQNIQKLFKLSNHHYGEDFLEKWWNKYMIDLEVSPPQNPLYEASFFSDYIRNNTMDDSFKSLINYEEFKIKLSRDNLKELKLKITKETYFKISKKIIEPESIDILLVRDEKKAKVLTCVVKEK